MAATPAPQALAGVPALAPERRVEWPKRTRARLANGMEVILAEQHSIPKFTGRLFLRSGNADVAKRATGLAEITATVVRTGTRGRSSRKIEEDLRGLGADLSTSAGSDTTAIAFDGLTEFTEPLLTLVGELAREAAFPEGEFERERRQMLEGVRLQRTEPDFLAGERLRKVLFGGHPYAQVAPSEEQVAAYRREDLVSVYREFYSPSNAMLVMVGDFHSGEMLALVERVFDGWKGPEVKKTAAPAPLRPAGRRVHLVHVPGAVQTQVLAGCHAITRRHPDWVRLLLANSIYGGAFNSRLVMNIREEKGYTYSPRSGVNPLQQHGYFTISAAVRNDVVAATLVEMFYELDKMRALAVPEAELADARNYMSGVFSLGVATQDGLLGQLSTVALYDLPDDYLENYRDRVRALKAEDVLFAARAYFDSANMQIVIVGDRGAVESQAALFGDVVAYDSAGNQTPKREANGSVS